jgi:hypothetical protein
MMSEADNSQIGQNIGATKNQTIGQVLGGMVVYGTVIYNNPPAEPDSATAQTKDPKIGANPYKGLLAFQETDGDRFFGRDPQINELGVHDSDRKSYWRSNSCNHAHLLWFFHHSPQQ